MGDVTGNGLTVIINVSGVPGTLLIYGVTVIVAIAGMVPVLVAVNDGRFPVPLAPNPIDVLLLVQLKVVPATGLVNITGVVADPLQ